MNRNIDSNMHIDVLDREEQLFTALQAAVDLMQNVQSDSCRAPQALLEVLIAAYSDARIEILSLIGVMLANKAPQMQSDIIINDIPEIPANMADLIEFKLKTNNDLI